MYKVTLKNYKDEVRTSNPEQPWNSKLQLFKDSKVSVFYSPFEHINKKAKVAICGITPGRTQATEAMSIAKTGLIADNDLETIQAQAKQAASFKGFRKPLSAMLDLVGLNEKLGLDSCNRLFDSNADLVHYTSALRYPVILANGSNYNGTPSPNKHHYLRQMIDTYLTEEVEALGSDCLWIPLGKGATGALEYLVEKGVMGANQLLSGLPHPSGANAERVAYFLGNKTKDKLSIKVNPDIIDSAKSQLMVKIKAV
ncbi:hypothetical protein AB3A40_001806 [Vibrio alginolyticus]